MFGRVTGDLLVRLAEGRVIERDSFLLRLHLRGSLRGLNAQTRQRAPITGADSTRSRVTTRARRCDGRGMRKLAQVVALVVLGLVLAVEAAFAAPTKAEFIRQGDALCKQVQRELAPLRRRAEAAKSLSQAQQWA